MANVCGVCLSRPVRYSSRVTSWNFWLPSLVKSMDTLGLPVWSNPARALLMAAPVSAGGSLYTYHASGTSLTVSAGLCTSA